MNRVEMENTVSTSNRTDSQQENLEIWKAKERKLNRKPRERGRSFIPTDIPEKDAIEEKHNEKMRKQALKNSKQLKRKIMDNSDSSKKKRVYT
jgi:TRAP-type C4-dicarboxylate transport system substrate-binding protein